MSPQVAQPPPPTPSNDIIKDLDAIDELVRAAAIIAQNIDGNNTPALRRPQEMSPQVVQPSTSEPSIDKLLRMYIDTPSCDFEAKNDLPEPYEFDNWLHRGGPTPEGFNLIPLWNQQHEKGESVKHDDDNTHESATQWPQDMEPIVIKEGNVWGYIDFGILDNDDIGVNEMHELGTEGTAGKQSGILTSTNVALKIYSRCKIVCHSGLCVGTT